ncbi:ATP synthase F1 subunit gamma [Halarcobacter anaerophilus]|jgi:F-type H+-transporting ATPase subunit gamma|uniref:ATP synthase gamma chain n=1 Tax=Halarcobacter anaerophilus TaxID=877500 RepID=A0A4Q0XY50_9BACT|nr:ATP synthase F1 subunit gamma [Halarcobacter anaerophilus]QDF29675.1 ATP synthase, F1 complex, gamma subunit [Halarcobacter anaerophilus]RXJ62600.1 F0F1 ATP synthase subunit gamma [Halarcobacter anaerophilus]
MANLKEIKLKIGSVKNTQKTTKAMKLVSSAKLTRTRQLSEQSRSYARKINEVLSEIANRVSKVQGGGNHNKAFIPVENPKTVDLVFVTADKGLCGGFNMATIKTVSKLAEEYESKGAKVRYRVAGRKGVDYFSFQGKELSQAVSDLSSAPDYDRASEFIADVVKDFQNGETDKVILIYNGFLNMLTQEIRVTELLPISLENVESDKNETSMLEIEPDDDEEVLEELTGKYIDFNMYYSLIDSLAAEHSARMQAMEAATNNAKDRVNSLTIEYNKARQAAITTELIEIISGVESLK